MAKAVSVLLTALVILSSLSIKVRAVEVPVQIENIDVTCSEGADAGHYTTDACTAIIEPRFMMPDAWCSIEITVKNHSALPARLSNVLVDNGAKDNSIKIEYGINDRNEGETLSPGEECIFTVVLSLDTDQTELDGICNRFSVTLVYDLDYESINKNAPQTGDDTFKAVLLMAISFTGIFIFGKKNEKKDQIIRNT